MSNNFVTKGKLNENIKKSLNYNNKLKSSTNHIFINNSNILGTSSNSFENKFKMSKTSIDIDKLFIQLSILLMDYYYNNCYKLFPLLSNYRVSIFQIPQTISDNCLLENALNLSSMGDELSLFINAIKNIDLTIKDLKIIQKHLLLHFYIPNHKYTKGYYYYLIKSINQLESIDVIPEYIESIIYFLSKKDLILSIIDSHLSKQKKQ